MTIQEYIQYRNITGNPGSAWLQLISNSDEYKTLVGNTMQKSDPNYTKYAKLLYDDVDNFFSDLSREINLSSDVNDILIFIMQMDQHCIPFITKKVIYAVDEIMIKMNLQKHIDVVFSMLANQFAINIMLDEYINAGRHERIHRLFFLMNMYKLTDTFNKIDSMENILHNYHTYLSKTRGFTDNQVSAYMNILNEIKRI